MRKEPEVVTVTLKKHNGMGLSIVAAKVGNNIFEQKKTKNSFFSAHLWMKLFAKETFSYVLYFLKSF